MTDMTATSTTGTNTTSVAGTAAEWGGGDVGGRGGHCEHDHYLGLDKLRS